MNDLISNRIIQGLRAASQATVVVAAGLITTYACAYRPYIVCGELVSSFGDEYHRVAPMAADGVTTRLDVSLYIFQFLVIAIVSVAAILMLRSCTSRRSIYTTPRRAALAIGILHFGLLPASSPSTWIVNGFTQTVLALIVVVSAAAVSRTLQLVAESESGLGRAPSTESSASAIDQQALTEMRMRRRGYLQWRAEAMTGALFCGAVSYVCMAIAFAATVAGLAEFGPGHREDGGPGMYFAFAAPWIVGLASIGIAALFGCRAATKQADEAPYVPPPPRVPTNVSARHSLLRGSSPPPAPRADLLRAAAGGVRLQPDLLLRGSATASVPEAGSDAGYTVGFSSGYSSMPPMTPEPAQIISPGRHKPDWPGRVGHIAAVLPFVAFTWMCAHICLFDAYADKPSPLASAVGLEFSGSGVALAWVPVCITAGLVSIFGGIALRRWIIVVEGLWACSAALILVPWHQIATF